MTKLARYFILGIISFLFFASSPGYGVTMAGIGNIARAQSVYYENRPFPSEFAYLSGGLLILATIGTIIYMVFFMKLEKDNVES